MRHFNVKIDGELQVMPTRNFGQCRNDFPIKVLQWAVKAAEKRHGSNWELVTNGRVTVTRNQYLNDPNWLFHASESVDHKTLDEIYNQPPMFAVIEYSSGFAVRHLKSGKEHWLSDGVDVFNEEEEELLPGTPQFTAEWSKALNLNEEETLEAYFTPMLPTEVLDIIYKALREANIAEINDVTMENGVDEQKQIIITTDNGHRNQVWVIDSESILECECID